MGMNRWNDHGFWLPVAAVLCFGFFAQGCCSSPTILNDGKGPLETSKVQYDSLRDQYNRRTRNIDQFYSKARIRFEWVDPQNKPHVQEGGDSTLIVRKPSDLALAVSHELTETLFWLGSNHQQFWALELKPPNGAPPRATVGRHGDLNRDRTIRLPVPIEPAELMMLVGIVDLPTRNLSGDQTVYERNGRLVVDLPLGDNAQNKSPFMRVEIDAEKHRPTWLAVHDPKRPNQPIMFATIGRYQKLPKHQVVKQDWPSLPTDILIEVPRRQTRIKITLSHFNDGRPSRIDDDPFILKNLLEAWGIKPQNVEHLGKPKPGSGKADPNRVSSQGL